MSVVEFRDQWAKLFPETVARQRRTSSGKQSKEVFDCFKNVPDRQDSVARSQSFMSFLELCKGCRVSDAGEHLDCGNALALERAVYERMNSTLIVNSISYLFFLKHQSDSSQPPFGVPTVSLQEVIVGYRQNIQKVVPR